VHENIARRLFQHNCPLADIQRGWHVVGVTALFIEADEPLLVFSSVEMAEQHLEAVDVREGIYTQAFGPAGEPFSIVAEGESVVICPLSQPADPDGLRKLLRRSLQAVGETAPLDADLPTLVAATEAVWNKRGPLSKRFGTVISLWGCIAAGVILAVVVAVIWPGD